LGLQCEKFPDYLRNYKLLKKGSVHEVTELKLPKVLNRYKKLFGFRRKYMDGKIKTLSICNLVSVLI
jgi:hypothetical protein